MGKMKVVFQTSQDPVIALYEAITCEFAKLAEDCVFDNSLPVLVDLFEIRRSLAVCASFFSWLLSVVLLLVASFRRWLGLRFCYWVWL
jgi:hypothetical protein